MSNQAKLDCLSVDDETSVILSWWELTYLKYQGFFTLPEFDGLFRDRDGNEFSPTRYIEQVLDFHYGKGPMPTITVERDKLGKWNLVDEPMLVYSVLAWLRGLWWGSTAGGGWYTYQISPLCKYPEYRGAMYNPCNGEEEFALSDSKLKAIVHGQVRVIIKPGKLTEEESKRLVLHDKELISSCDIDWHQGGNVKKAKKNSLWYSFWHSFFDDRMKELLISFLEVLLVTTLVCHLVSLSCS